MSETLTDPWAWLLGKTSDGSWRMSGSRSSPSANPKVLLLRRAIPHPKPVLSKLVETIKESDPADRLRWICHRSSRGERRYWLLFLLTQEQKTTQIQYLFGIEFVSQKELGLWFFSGFQEPNHLGQAFLEFYEDDKNNALPRFSLDGTEDLPLREWLPLALKEELTFRWGFEESKNFPHQTPKQRIDHSKSVNESVSPKDSTRPLAVTSASPTEDSESKRDKAPQGSVDSSSIRDESQLVSKAIQQTEIEQVSKHQLQLIVCERGAPRLVVLRDKRNTLGRHPLCHVVSPTLSVSARHAIIELNSEGAQIFDLGSQNG
ncbi:MAG: FHA domain-containing protein, partial [Planctomycetota bacterium]|nr:FHA domain-containing protein [Planctomycetota bacterium]